MSRKIAIIGAGPSGCYLAQALLKLEKTLEVDILDRLPVPYGLVRYGVAPDHQGTKAVTRQFARLFERQGVAFVGNLDICTGDHGGDISLDELRDLYDVTVLATGLSRDRALGVPGEELEGVIGAGTLTRHWNDHPDAHEQEPPQAGTRVVVVGNGNVAMDVLRILSKGEGDYEGSDFGAHHAEHLAAAGIERIDVVGRSPAHAAKFDPVMVKEIAKTGGLAFRIEDQSLSDAAEDDPRLAALAHVRAASDPAPHCEVVFHFGWAPVRFAGEDRLEAAHFARADGSDVLDLPCDMAVSAIGFCDDGRLDREALVEGATDLEAGRLAPGLYAAGWFRRGPRGTIPDNRTDSQAVAQAIVDDLEAMPDAEKPGRAALADRFDHLTDYEGWQRIDAAEREAVQEGRVRAKVRNRQEMLKLALNMMETTP